MSEKEKYAVTAVIRIGAKRSSAYHLAKFREENGGAISSFFLPSGVQRRARRCCKRPQHLARPRPACIKLDGDVRGRRRIPGARDAAGEHSEAHQDSEAHSAGHCLR